MIYPEIAKNDITEKARSNGTEPVISQYTKLNIINIPPVTN